MDASVTDPKKHLGTEVDVASIAPSSQGVAPGSSGHEKKSWNPFRRKSSTSDAKSKEKRESISDRGAFRIEYRNGVPIAVENTDWPPGVNYTETSQSKILRSKDGTLGDFYNSQGAIAAGGETAGNSGPDPDWVPELSEEEKQKLKKDKSGRYGKATTHKTSKIVCILTNVPIVF